MRQRTSPEGSGAFFTSDGSGNGTSSANIVINEGSTSALNKMFGSDDGPVLPMTTGLPGGGRVTSGGAGGGSSLPSFGAIPALLSASASAGTVGPAPKPEVYKRQAGIVSLVGLLLFLVSSEAYRYGFVVLALCGLGLLFAKYLSEWLMAKEDGTPQMREVSNAIREGAGAFLGTQYSAIARIAVIVAAIVFFSYQLRPSDMAASGVNALSPFTLGFLAALSFIVGALSSSIVGYASMVIACRTNIRVTSAAAKKGYLEALVICFRGGSFSAMLVLGACVMGITLLYTLLYTLFANDDGTVRTGGGPHGGSSSGRSKETIGPEDIPLLCVGYGFGASFVALFQQLGGGIYTKGADVGADMVGKVEQGIPEDDPRNPAVIADLVGDNVGESRPWWW